MAVEFLTPRIDVPRGSGRRELIGSVSFQRKVRVAEVALRGFLLDFVTNDHHIDIVEVATEFGGTEGETVHFRVDCQYADKNSDGPVFRSRRCARHGRLARCMMAQQTQPHSGALPHF
jgi:hypothetical protein